MKNLPPVVLALIAINAVVFGLGAFLPDLGDTISLHCSLFFPKNAAFHVGQILSYMFLHGGFSHLLFNMVALASFGAPLTMVWGWQRFLIFYFVTGIGAALVYTAVNYYQFSAAYEVLLEAGFGADAITSLLETFKADPTLAAKVPQETMESLLGLYHSKAVGASGAIYGILVAFGILYPNAKLRLIFHPFPIAAKYFIPALVLLDLFSGVTGFSLFGAGIAHFAHVGGAVIGFLIMLYWKKNPPLGLVPQTPRK
jgi:membrane associated rhomboid family serine protease